MEAEITESWKGFLEWAPEFYLVRNIPETIFDPGSDYETMSTEDLYDLKYGGFIHGETGRIRVGVRYYF